MTDQAAQNGEKPQATREERQTPQIPSDVTAVSFMPGDLDPKAPIPERRFRSEIERLASL